MYASQKIQAFQKGVFNKVNNEVIPQDASSDSLSWLTNNGGIEIMGGRQVQGGSGPAGSNYGIVTAYQVDGTPILFQKVDSKIQYMFLSDTAWTDVITNLTVDSDYTFSEYQSNAGAALYIFGIDGIFKVMLANPASYSSLYDPAKNYKGFGFIDKSSAFMWGISNDYASLYRGYIDEQIYTTVSSEVTAASATGTLSFKSGNPTRTAFGIVMTKGGVTYTDHNNGILVSSNVGIAGNGTINYTTGDWTTPGNITAGTVDYSWEDSNNHGVSQMIADGGADRVAGEPLVIPQKVKIITVISFAGSYFSLQQFTSHKLTIDSDDLGYDNNIFRDDIGIQSLRGAVGTSIGIIFINTANPSRAIMQKLVQNVLGDNFDVKPLFGQFAFENYAYDDALLDTWDQFIIVGCKQKDSGNNDRLIMCNVQNGTVDPTYYGIRSSAKVNGILYGGDPVSQTTYQLFTGFDDNGTEITNYWDSKGETFKDDILKKVRKMRFKGKISPGRNIQVFVSPDGSDFQLIGTIRGDGSYVDYSSSYAIGTAAIGTVTVGGGDAPQIYDFTMQIKTPYPKFRKRVIRFVGLGYGYCSIEQLTDFDIWLYEQKMSAKYRSDQNVNLAGDTDQP